MTLVRKIGNMHCAACMQAVRQAALGVEGVIDAKVDLKAAVLSFTTSSAETALDQLEATLKSKIEELGYTYTTDNKENEPNNSSRVEWALALLLAGAFFAVFLYLDRSGLLSRFFSGLMPKNSVSLIALSGAGFVMGLIASGSSCLAVVGSIIISFSSLASNGKVLKPNLLFHVGRIVSFTLLGAGLAALGASVSGIFSGSPALYASAGLQILLGVIMLASASMILGNTTVSSFVSKLVPKQVDKLFTGLAKSTSVWAPLSLGALTFILPCGFTQSMQAQALASGQPLVGAILLGSFALGTAPVLLLAGISVSWSKKKDNKILLRFAGLILSLFAIWTVVSGFSMLQGAGVRESGVLPDNNQVLVSETKAETTIIEMHIKYEGFTPELLELPAGKDITWIVWGDEVTGCTNALVVPALKLRFKVKPGKNAVTFRSPDKPQVINYSCWMGMVRGQLRVVQP